MYSKVTEEGWFIIIELKFIILDIEKLVIIL